MILYEFEGKKLLTDAGIAVPASQLVTLASENITLKFPVVLKAQVLSGKRADAGGIVFVEKIEDCRLKIKELLGSVINKEKVEKVLVEEKIDIEKEYYVSISYNTETRGPVLSISESGGTGIEDRGVNKYQVSSIKYYAGEQAVELNKEGSLEGVPGEIIEKLVKLFFEQDCLLLEVNPLIRTKEGDWIALDAKVKLDDFAKPRHKDWEFAPRSAPGHTPTRGEIEAKKIDEGDYRGTAGSSYFDLDGDIAVLSSGGGVSLTALDSLINYGGKPANFTEYSGNPPKEKVAKLTKVVLDKPGIHGLWVIGTVVANFTDIYETLTGFIEGLRETEKELGAKFDFPIVIRRGGPRVEEAYEMLKKVKDFDLHLQGEETSIAQSAKSMAELAEKYALSEGGKK
ncbi:MAG TPA: ATP-grasp domain-containing protein [Patescibacteria group bacterium]|nr:ATP-grasp domain-containing protein [Patescibacteria group bacterium]